MTPTGRDKNIDSVLEHFDKDIFISKKEIEGIVDKSQADMSINQMLAIGLIELVKDTIVIGGGGHCYILTAFGVEVKRHGSWTKYLSDKEEEKTLSRQQIQSTITTNNITRRILYITIIVTAISAIVAGISAWISWLDYSKSNEQHSSYNALINTIERLPKIQTPITFNSDNRESIEKLATVDSELVTKIQELIPGFGILGQLFETEEFYVIVGIVPNDTGSPRIITINKKGEEIDSYIIWETAGGGMGSYSTNIVTILPDKTILFMDSTLTRNINEEGTDEIEGTDSISVTTKKYIITEKGEIKTLD